MKDYVGTKIAANYFRGSEAVGGKLFFDESGMTFKSHIFNIQRGETRIEYSQIQGAQRGKGIIPTSVSVFTKDGFEHKFVVYHRDDLIAFIESKKSL